MGLDICCEKKQVKNSFQSLAPSNEPDISLQKYTSPNDSSYEDIETKYNVLTYIKLIDYMNLLENFTLETATVQFPGELKTQFSRKDAFLSQEINVDEFQSFIENKLYKINEIKDLRGNNEEMMNIFKQIAKNIFEGLQLKLRQNFKDDSFNMTKKNLIPLGVIFCESNVIGKVKLIFDLFKNEENKFTKSDELNLYLLSSFLTCSYCIINARQKYSKMNNDDLLKCLRVSELKDSQHLVKVFNEKFFDKKEELTWEEFKEKFNKKDEGFQWLLSSKGTRKLLEENNV